MGPGTWDSTRGASRGKAVHESFVCEDAPNFLNGIWLNGLVAHWNEAPTAPQASTRKSTPSRPVELPAPTRLRHHGTSSPYPQSPVPTNIGETAGNKEPSMGARPVELQITFISHPTRSPC